MLTKIIVILIGLACITDLKHPILFASNPDDWSEKSNIKHQLNYPNYVIFFLSDIYEGDVSEVRLNYSFNNSKVWSYKYADIDLLMEGSLKILLIYKSKNVQVVSITPFVYRGDLLCHILGLCKYFRK